MILFVINNVLIDYTAGMVVIAAPSMARCREIFVDEFGHEDEFDAAIDAGDFKAIPCMYEEGLVSYVYGGG